MTTAQISRAKSLKTSGYTLAQIAQILGVSVSTIEDNVK